MPIVGIVKEFCISLASESGICSRTIEKHPNSSRIEASFFIFSWLAKLSPCFVYPIFR